MTFYFKPIKALLILPVVAFLLISCSEKAPSTQSGHNNNGDNNDSSNLIPPVPPTGTDLSGDIKGLTERAFGNFNIPLVQGLIYTTSESRLFSDYYQSILGIVSPLSLFGMLESVGGVNVPVLNPPDTTGNIKDGFLLPNNMVVGVYHTPMALKIDGSWDIFLDGQNYCLNAYNAQNYNKIVGQCGTYGVSTNITLDIMQIKNQDAVIYFILTDKKEYIYLPPIHWRSAKTILHSQRLLDNQKKNPSLGMNQFLLISQK